MWSDPDGIKREACFTIDQGGQLPSGWHGACWPFVAAKMKFMMYGPYDIDQLWRVNLAGIIGLIGLAWVMIEPLPYRRYVGIFLLTVYPLLTIILLYGGGFDVSLMTMSIIFMIGLALITFGRLAGRGLLGETMAAFASAGGIGGWLLVGYAVVMPILGVDSVSYTHLTLPTKG